MKRFLLLLALVSGVVFTSSAQEITTSAGYRGYAKNTLFYQAMNGGYVGVDFLSRELIGPVDLGFGLNFSSLIGSSSFRYGATNSYRTASNDLEVPVYLQYGFDLGGASTLNIFAGPTFFCGITLREGIKSDYWGNSRTDLYKEPNVLGFQYKRFDCLVGGGISLLLRDHFMIKAACDYGLVDRCGNDISKDFSEGRPSFHNVQFTVGFAYLFDL